MKKTHLVGLVLIAVAIAVIIALVGDFSSYETFASARETPNSLFHVVGTLDKSKPTEFNALENANRFAFHMKDKNGESVKVIYPDIEPRDFKKSDQIVITGKMCGNEFCAQSMVLKCPSKYTDEKESVREFKAKGAAN
jgi:cytochrome c-type biogenesis protein CcmE